jgi:hypothetical protein
MRGSRGNLDLKLTFICSAIKDISFTKGGGEDVAAVSAAVRDSREEVVKMFVPSVRGETDRNLYPCIL